MKVFLPLLFIFIALQGITQKNEQYYPNNQLQWRGQHKKFRIKGTYGYDVAIVKDGLWQYFYPNGELAHQAQYKAKKVKAVPKGQWEYYSQTGELLKREYYKFGNLQKEEFYSTGVFNFTTDSFVVKTITADTFLLINYLKGEPFRELLVNNGNGVYIYPPKKYHKALEYEMPALADDGFKLKDTGQNYIGNYSFEHSKKNDRNTNEIHNVADTFIHHWYSATGTPDYFKGLKHDSRTGESFCGIRIYSNSEYLEYMQNQMKMPLKAGVTYCCRVFFRLNPASGLATDAIGFRFDNELLKFYYRASVLPTPDIINKPGQILGEKDRWMQLTGAYTAKGGERYFTIGGFRALGAQNAKQLNQEKKQEAYYLIDDVFVWEVDKESECPCNAYTVPDSLKPEPVITQKNTDTLYEVGKTFVIKNIFFDTDKDELLPKSFVALDSLVELLYLYPTMEIEVSGHTDNTGTEERNRELSLQRAQAVVNYLKEFGIAENRLTYAGYATDQPIDTNETPDGRQNNRRVQFKILKM